MNAAAAKAKKSRSRGAVLPNEVTLAMGRNLKKLRTAANKTQVELAYDAEVERSRISKMEGGHINPSLLTLATICHCLEISLAELFAGITATLAPISEGGLPRRANQAVLDKPSSVQRKNPSK